MVVVMFLDDITSIQQVADVDGVVSCGAKERSNHRQSSARDDLCEILYHRSRRATHRSTTDLCPF